MWGNAAGKGNSDRGQGEWRDILVVDEVEGEWGWRKARKVVDKVRERTAQWIVCVGGVGGWSYKRWRR